MECSGHPYLYRVYRLYDNNIVTALSDLDLLFELCYLSDFCHFLLRHLYWMLQTSFLAILNTTSQKVQEE